MLKVNNIETFYGLIYALKGVSMEIRESSITSVLGSNGAGKSTILKTIIGLIDDQPEKGNIEFQGQDVVSRAVLGLYPVSPDLPRFLPGL